MKAKVELYKAKVEYVTPTIEHIKLDNEISLVLESSPPVGPNQGSLRAPEHFNNDPFQNSLA
jgi:hypothetical protein